MKEPKFKIGDIVKYYKDAIHIVKVNAIIEDGDGYKPEYKYLLSDNTIKPETVLSAVNTSIKEIKLPTSWDEVENYVKVTKNENWKKRWCEIQKLIRHTDDNASDELWSHISFMQLILLRDIYRQGWKPDWDWAGSDPKYYIAILWNKINVFETRITKRVLTFKTEEEAKTFADTFKVLIIDSLGKLSDKNE